MVQKYAFPVANSFGNANNTIVIDGGKLATGSATSYTLASTHGIQVGGAATSGISVHYEWNFDTYDGVITDKPSTTGILVKQGAGALQLGGINTYTGATTINNGILKIATEMIDYQFLPFEYWTSFQC
jgi:autotransporter-associated beta strand protein